MKKIGKATYLTERKEIVDFMMNHPCIRVDFTKPSSGWKMGEVHEGDLVGVKCPSTKYGSITVYGNINWYSDSNEYSVMHAGDCIKANFGAEDINTIVERKNAVVVEKDDLVAIIENHINGSSIHVMKVKCTDAHCSSACKFEDVDL